MSDYYNQRTQYYTERTRLLVEEFPNFIREYFRSLSTSTQATTRYGYALDVKTFLNYLTSCHHLTMADIDLELFKRLEATDIEEYMEHLLSYEDRQNSEYGLARKLSSLKGLFNYLMSHREYDVNYDPTAIVRMPSIPKNDIIYLDSSEIRQFLEFVENYAEHCTDHELLYFNKTKLRDLAIVTLLLGTGIRVSECAGINIADIDLENNSVWVTRKRKKRQQVRFPEATKEVLMDYILFERKLCVGDDVTPLFYSLQKKRMSVRSIERVVRKYATQIIPYKHITAHKLRASYATELYENSSDIYLTADALGHSSIATTTKYASISQKRRQSAPDYIKSQNKER